MFFDPFYFLFLSPALLLAFWAQMRVKSTFHRGMRVHARLSGAAAARYILDQAGLQNVNVEETHGVLSDHYDPSRRVLRLSRDVYHGQSAASVGIAAHEAGHAIQHAQRYLPLVVRGAAVPAATFGSGFAIILLFIGAIMSSTVFGQGMLWAGFISYGAVLFFQVVNLPVEFDASNRAKRILTEMNIVDGDGAVAVRKVLNAAGWTYVAATLQTLLTLLYFLLRFGGFLNRND